MLLDMIAASCLILQSSNVIFICETSNIKKIVHGNIMHECVVNNILVIIARAKKHCRKGRGVRGKGRVNVKSTRH